jgi:3-dehydroquinate synthase
MAAELSGIDTDDIDRLRQLIASAGLPTEPPKIGAAAMSEAMGMDKKVIGKQLRFVVLDHLGAAGVTSDYEPAILERVLRAAD